MYQLNTTRWRCQWWWTTSCQWWTLIWSTSSCIIHRPPLYRHRVPRCGATLTLRWRTVLWPYWCRRWSNLIMSLHSWGRYWWIEGVGMTAWRLASRGPYWECCPGVLVKVMVEPIEDEDIGLDWKIHQLTCWKASLGLVFYFPPSFVSAQRKALLLASLPSLCNRNQPQPSLH